MTICCKMSEFFGILYESSISRYTIRSNTSLAHIELRIDVARVAQENMLWAPQPPHNHA